MSKNVERDEEPRTHPISCGDESRACCGSRRRHAHRLEGQGLLPSRMRPSRTRHQHHGTRWRCRGRQSACGIRRQRQRDDGVRLHGPDEVGEYSWTVVFPKEQAEDLVHKEGSLPITVRTLAHDTSLAVWGVPSPIVMDHPFRIQVGATCSAGCDLKGKEIEICDETGASIALGTLGETPLDGTRALYWTEVDLVAPMMEGSTSRSVRFAPTNCGCLMAERRPDSDSRRSSRPSIRWP